MHEPSEFKAICFTAKKNSGNAEDVTEDSYGPLILHWEKHCHVHPPYYEKDSKGRLHMHGILMVKKGFYKKRLQCTGFYVFTTDCQHLEQWLNYCAKADPMYILVKQLRQERREIDNTQYMF